MSAVTRGIINMPYDMAMADEVSRFQFHATAQAEFLRLTAVKAEFDAYKEGSEEAFGAVVEQKRRLQERVKQLEATIESQQQLIVRFRTEKETKAG